MNSLWQASLRKIQLAPTSRCLRMVNGQLRNGHTVRVILTSDLADGKGYAGEVCDVKAGFARNYLIPLKKALYATPTNFARAGVVDPELRSETAEERKARERLESDEDLKAADFLRYYLRNKTLKIWRMVDPNSTLGTSAGAPIHPGMVDHKAVREKLSKQLKIDLEDFETVQINPEHNLHSSLEDEEGPSMEDRLEKMEALDEGETCKVELRALGEYVVKINLKGDHAVGLRLKVASR